MTARVVMRDVHISRLVVTLDDPLLHFLGSIMWIVDRETYSIDERSIFSDGKMDSNEYHRDRAKRVVNEYLLCFVLFVISLFVWVSSYDHPQLQKPASSPGRPKQETW